MKIALSIWSCHGYLENGQWTNADFIKFAAQETEAAGVELLTYFWKPEELEEVRGALTEHRMQVAAVGASNNFSHPDPQRRREEVAEILSAVNLAEAFGARIVRVFAGDRPPDGYAFDEVKSWIVEGLREAAAAAAEKGIVLCLENHGIFAGKAAQVQAILDEVGSPYLRSTFDTGNFLLVGEDPSAALEALSPQVEHVHFKDFVPVDGSYEGRAYTGLTGERFAGRIAGEGTIDLQGLIGRLHQDGYNGWLTVEYEGDDEQKHGAAGSISNLARILRSLPA
ncbi:MULTISPECIES: sugar phosphate isomerase/epimerase family protein [Paenibacillus]|uniref:sugar phosphate isomerase/epimerase family protein n=1 Tax=Paenibacillus TaxID=44249 RepID=UPI0022B90903|nr:sugar phosphate isomerase/epimerase family protein [Paenibacillus caseinilyticus]MCZ8523191.1 sugar phosphate isomerase/epimerase [Paenibacillus caseinilyticus]